MKWRVRIAMLVVITALTVLGIPGITPGAPAPARAAGPCTHTWALGSGTFSAAQFAASTSWVQGTSPTSTANVCFVGVSVRLNSVTTTLDTIDVDPTASLFLASGTLNLTSSVDLGGIVLSGGVVINLASDATVGAGRTLSTESTSFGTILTTGTSTLTVAGTLAMSGGNGVRLAIDTVNTGTIEISGAALTLTAGRTLTNSGTINIGSNGTVTGGALTTTLANSGTIALSNITNSTTVMSNLTLSNSGAVTFNTADARFTVAGTSSGTWSIGGSGESPCTSRFDLRPQGGPFTFTGGSVTGPGCFLPTNTVNIGASVGFTPGLVQNQAVLQLAGNRTLPPITMFNASVLEIYGGTAVAVAPIAQIGPTAAQYFGGDGRLEIPSGNPFGHAGGNAFQVRDSLDLVVAGPWSTLAGIGVLGTATLTSLGTWSVGPGSGFEVAPGANLRNEGLMLLDGSTTIGLGGSRGIDNAGTMRLTTGTIDMRTRPLQITSSAITAGRFELADATHWIFFPTVAAIAGELRIEGSAYLDAGFSKNLPALRALTTIAPTGVLELDGAAALTTTTTLSNQGRLALTGAPVVNVSGYSQTGTLAVEIGPTSGKIVTTTASLAGTLEVFPAPGHTSSVAGRTIVESVQPVATNFDDVIATDGGTAGVGIGSGDALLTYDPANAPLVVTTTNPTGTGSLAAAIAFANANPGDDAITFDIAGAGPHRIFYNVPALLTVTGPLSIDATTQPGYDGSRPMVELDGSGVVGLQGIRFTLGSTGSSVRGLSITGFGDRGVQVLNDVVVVEDNWVGVRPDGTYHPNAVAGIWGVANDVDIRRNRISGNSDGGIVWSEGGVVVIEQNEIADNADHAISFEGNDNGTSSFEVIGNTILGNGLAAVRTVPGGTGTGPGPWGRVVIVDNQMGAPGNGNGQATYPTIDLNRWTAIVTRNTITDNPTRAGVLIQGQSGVVVVSVTDNSIARNAGLGINLSAVTPIDAVTPNDPLDDDVGVNGLQNFPILADFGVSAPGFVRGTLSTKANRNYQIEVWANLACDASGHGEGETRVASIVVNSGPTGSVGFEVGPLAGVPAGGFLTATATGAEGTSEFSPCLPADADPPDPDEAVAEFLAGWEGVGTALGDWLSRFDAAGDDDTAVVTPRLDELFGLTDLVDDLGLPVPSAGSETLADLCADLAVQGVTVEYVVGGACGLPAPPVATDVIQVRWSTTLLGLAEDAGFTGDRFDDETEAVLTALADALDLDATGGAWIGDLTVTVVAGVDENGFYLAPDTGVELEVDGTIDISGDGSVAGATTAIEGTAEATISVAFGLGGVRQRSIGQLPQRSVSGSASMSLGVGSGPFDLTWEGGWTLAGAAVSTGPQVLTGTLTLPGVTGDGQPSALTVVASLAGDHWRVTADGEVGVDYLVAGFEAGSLEFAGDIGPNQLDGAGTLSLTAPLPGGGQQITVAASFDRTSLALDGTLALGDLEIGSPSVLALATAEVTATFDAALPAGPLSGGVGIAAATATLIPTGPAGTANGLTGSVSSTGAIALAADQVELAIAGGAVIVTLDDVTLTAGPGTGPNLLSVANATGSFPALDDLAVTFSGLVLRKDGSFGATGVDVDSQGLAQSVGLAGVVPFDVEQVTVVFPDPSNLDQFAVSVVGRFDFSAFPSIAGFTPRIGLGGQVVTPDTPPAQNEFTFSVAVDDLSNGVVNPLDVGPLVLGFEGLPVGDYVLGGDVELGGFENGAFVPEFGGRLSVDGPSDSIISGVEVDIDGTLDEGPPVIVDVEGTVTVSGNLPGGVVVDELALTAGVRFGVTDGQLSLEPRLVGLEVGEISFPFGDFMTLRASDVAIDLAPSQGDNLLEVGSQGALGVEFGDEFPMLDGWGGSARGIALGGDLRPRLLPGFGFDLSVPPAKRFGLPEFLPLTLDEFGLTFPSVVTSPPVEGIPLTPEMLAGMRVRISGGLVADPGTWPISAAVDGLEVDLGLLTSGQFPITNLSGVMFGVEPFEMPGGMVIGGGLQLGTVDVDGTNVFYGRVFGDFSVADIGGGADLVVTQYGPVLLKVRAPLGIPLGPSGIVLAAAEGAAQFGGVGIPVPPLGDPIALLTTLTLPTDLTIDEDTIADAVAPSVAAGEYTWEEGFALSIAGDLIVAAAPGVISGRVTIGMNLGLPEGPGDPPGLQLVGKGEVTAFGIPLSEAGLLIDFADPIEPSLDLAFASPVPGSPLALLFPASATFGVQVRTDGVVLGTIEGLRVFVTRIAEGTLAEGQALFAATLDATAARLDAERSRPLARLLLDLDANGAVSANEANQQIDTQFMIDRILGQGGLPALPPATVSDAAFDRSARTATALLNESLLTAADLLADPAAITAFGLDPAQAMTALAEVVRVATADALAAFGDRFNPVFSMEGALQPTILGLPLGSPVVGGELFIDRQGLFFEIEGSLTEIGQTAVSLSFPLAAPLIDAALTAATLGISDQLQIGARLPFGGVVDTLIGGGDLPQFQPLDPNWAVTIGGELSVLGFETAELSGMAFLPNQTNFLDSRIQKLFEQAPGTPVDEDLIPITTEAHYDALVEYGGILVTASLRAPRLITDPASQIAALPPPPDDPLQFAAWLDDLAAIATQTDTPARVQFFVPGITNVADGDAAIDWASSFYLEGVWDGAVLGLDLGQATLALTPAGLDLTGSFPLLGASATVTLNTALLDSGASLPSAGVDVALSSATVSATLQRMGIPSSLVPQVGATGRFRAFTPGFDPDSPDPFRRNGGIEVQATLGTPGLIGSTGFSFALSPRPGGLDVRGTAFAQQIGPIAGVTISNASLTVDVIGGVASVRVTGSANVLGAQATVDGVLNGDLTGSLTLTLATGGVMNLGGLQVNGTAVLTTTRVNGQLRGSLGVLGTATLPAWLATAAGAPTIAAGACVDTAGNMEARLAMPAMNIGPGGLVRIGRNNPPLALPAGPAACTIPVGAPSQTATGPLVAFRVAGGVASLVIDGNLTFHASNAAIAGLKVTGSLNGNTGLGSLAVAFSGGTMNLGGFAINGSATLTLGAGPTLAMAVNGSLTVPGLISNATVSGSGNQNGITSLTLAVTGFTLGPVVSIDSASLSLTRIINTSNYHITAGLQVDVPNVANNLAVNGSFNSAGNGTLTMTATSLGIRGAQITNGSFALVKNGASMSLSAAGTFTLFGTSLEVVQANLSLSATAIDGSLVIRPFGGGTLSLAGWTIGGTLRLAFAGATVTIEIDNGTISIPGWGGAVTMDGSISVPPQNGAMFTLSLPNNGLRLGGAPSPFFATGTVRLTFNNNVGTLALSNGSLAWRDGATTVASINVPSMSISTNGAVSASLTGFSVAAGAFALTVPSLTFAIDPQGLNARLALGAGTVAIPGLPTLNTPAFSISTGNFAITLVAPHIDLGIVRLVGNLVLRRTGSVFSLSVEGDRNQLGVIVDPASFSIEGLVDIDINDLTIASDGSYAIDVAVPRFGGDIGVVNARLQVTRTTGPNGSFSASLIGGRLLVGTAEPIPLPSLSFDTATRIDRTFSVGGIDLGPFFRMSPSSLRIRHTVAGVLRVELVDPVSVGVFDSSGTLTLNELMFETDGSFDGSITGRLALFGFKISTATFDLARQDGVVELRLSSGSGETLNLGFFTMSISGEARSDGTFSFSGSSSVSAGVTGFNMSGSASVTVSSSGISGSYSGSVCIGGCASTSGSLRSDGRISGTLRIDLNDDGDYNDLLEVNASWKVYLATGGIRVDINRDGDYDDFGDIHVGSGTNDDETAPSMAQPPNITVNANIGAGGSVRVYYSVPTASESNVDIPVRCTPAPGSLFVVGATEVTCRAKDENGNQRQRTFTVTVVANAAATVPTATNGATVLVEAAGFAPDSWVTVQFFSDPSFVGVYQTDPSGHLRLELVVPPDLPIGSHDIVLEGFGPDGSVRQVVQPFVIPGPTAPPGVLPPTGTDLGSLPTAAGLLVLFGALCLLVRRPRTGSGRATLDDTRHSS